MRFTAFRRIESKGAEAPHLGVRVHVEGERHVAGQHSLVDEQRRVVVEGRISSQHLEQQDSRRPPGSAVTANYLA